MVFNFGLIGALAIGQAQELLGVAEKKLDLKTDTVAFQYPLPCLVRVGTEVQFTTL